MFCFHLSIIADTTAKVKMHNLTSHNISLVYCTLLIISDKAATTLNARVSQGKTVTIHLHVSFECQ